jgi:hypothetical protein
MDSPLRVDSDDASCDNAALRVDSDSFDEEPDRGDTGDHLDKLLQRTCKSCNPPSSSSSSSSCVISASLNSSPNRDRRQQKLKTFNVARITHHPICCDDFQACSTSS